MPNVCLCLPYRRVTRLVLVLLAVSSFAACAPAISKQYREQADQSLSFPVLAADPSCL